MYWTGFCINVCLVSLGILDIFIGYNIVKCDVILSPSPAVVVEGEFFTLTCTYNGNQTVAGFSWLLNGNILAVILIPSCIPFHNPGPPDALRYEYACLSSKQSSFTMKQISQSNNGDMWQCAAAIPSYLYSGDISVIVQVAVTSVTLQLPNDRIIENVVTIFTCKTSASQPSANISWFKESGNDQSQIISSEISTLTTDVGNRMISTSVFKYNPNRNDSGYHIFCTAANIQERAPVISAKFRLNILYPPDGSPIIQGYPNGSIYKTVENSENTLTCMVSGGNPLATLTWTCFNNGSSAVTNGSTVTRSVSWKASRGSDRTCMCQSSHELSEIQTVTVNVTILYIEVPGIPKDFQAIEEHISERFALLLWKPGFNGGSNQTFVLLYKRSSEKDWKIEKVGDSNETMMIYTLRNLVSNSEYTVVLFARNSIGNSTSSTNITFKTKDRKDVVIQKNSALSSGIIGGIIGGIVLCVIAVALSWLIIRQTIPPCKGRLEETPNKPTEREQEYADLNQRNAVNANPVYDSLQHETENTDPESNNSYMQLAAENKDNDKHVYTDIGKQKEESEVYKV